jgi:hypothetical protein
MRCQLTAGPALKPAGQPCVIQQLAMIPVSRADRVGLLKKELRMSSTKGGWRYWGALICAGIVTILFLIIHVITIVIANRHSGLFAAVLSGCLPFFSELYWGYKLWVHSGIFFSPYNVTFIIIIGFTLLSCKLWPDFFD